MSHVDPNCQHGMLRRGCDLCEMIVQNADLRARVAELEAALHALLDAADSSDNASFGTLGTDFVRHVVDSVSGNKEESRNA